MGLADFIKPMYANDTDEIDRFEQVCRIHETRCNGAQILKFLGETNMGATNFYQVHKIDCFIKLATRLIGQ